MVEAVPLRRVDLASIEAGLELTLNQVREGRFKDAAACIIVFGHYEHGGTLVRAYGMRCSPLEIDGWLARAMTRSTQSNDTEAAPPSGTAA